MMNFAFEGAPGNVTESFFGIDMHNDTQGQPIVPPGVS